MRAQGFIELGPALDDAPGSAGGGGVDGERSAGGEVAVALKGQPEAAPHAGELRQARVPGLGKALAGVAQAEQQPSGWSGSISVKSQVADPQGSKSLSTGTWSAPGRAPFLSSRLCSGAVMSFMGGPPLRGTGG